MPTYKYIKTAKRAEQAVQTILVREKPVVGIKCLGVNIGAHGGTITLIAVSTWDGNVYIFDVKTCPAIMYEGQLLRLLQSAELVKVFHNCGPDSATLYYQFGVKIKNFFDTQIAYSVIMEDSGLSARRLSYFKLCEVYNQHLYIPSNDIQQLLVEDANVWARRPCTKELLTVASSYVMPLVPILFTKIDSALPKEKNDWFTHLCEENRLSMIEKRSKSGRKSNTKCPPNRRQTKSVHIVPLTEEMHFCL